VRGLVDDRNRRGQSAGGGDFADAELRRPLEGCAAVGRRVVVQHADADLHRVRS